MTFGLPIQNQWPWHDDFNQYLAQALDANNGGLNSWSALPTVGVDGQALSTEHVGYSGIDRNTNSFVRWSGTAWETLVGTGSSSSPIWGTAGRPASPVEGTFGFNTDLDTLEYYSGSAWMPVGGSALLELISTPPSNPVAGQQYYDPTAKALYVYSGGAWNPVGPVQSATEPTGLPENSLWLNTALTPPVLNIYSGGTWGALGGTGSGGSGSGGGSGSTNAGPIISQFGYTGTIATNVEQLVNSFATANIDWNEDVLQFYVFAANTFGNALTEWKSLDEKIILANADFQANQGIRPLGSFVGNAWSTGTGSGVETGFTVGTEYVNDYSLYMWFKDYFTVINMNHYANTAPLVISESTILAYAQAGMHAVQGVRNTGGNFERYYQYSVAGGNVPGTTFDITSGRLQESVGYTVSDSNVVLYEHGSNLGGNVLGGSSDTTTQEFIFGAVPYFGGTAEFNTNPGYTLQAAFIGKHLSSSQIQALDTNVKTYLTFIGAQ